jgi:putative addiction module component (TIGR02574 family)
MLLQSSRHCYAVDMSEAVASIRRQFNELNETERLQLLVELWGSLSGANSTSLSDVEAELIDRCLAEHAVDPHATVPAAAAAKRLLGRGSK